ncbi:hypothetical protein LOH54_04960 [Sulfurimonas sp. HSL-3221]|uniref:hypothetical protein n=1 Tax=Thiomicrolovo sulfuroxydans TaxID=2894755 RepID=UPI001E46DF85|nr:hypothetical protein [Sulfurimonas sp. HSL-3221]UFS63482.1 hypothetical protein LOH54_04960 [Sulfurimonas sp. HSL-3221]
MKFRLFTTLAPRSGSLAFLTIQILAANKIMHANRFALMEPYLARRCGIAINHLRAPVTVVSATHQNGTYRLSGRLTWASGYGIFDTLVIGFHCEGREFQAVVPFEPIEGFVVGEVTETFVGNAMRTVDVILDNYEVLEEHIIASHPLGTYTKNKSVSKTIHYALYGIGLGAVDALEDAEVRRAAEAKLEALKTAFLATKDGEELDRLRVELFELVLLVVTTGMILKGGSSVLSTERLQRYYRELVMFNANGLNTALKTLHKQAFLSAFEQRH